MLRLYYNPKCSKSRAALARLESAGLKPEVVDYLANPPARDDLLNLIHKLDGDPDTLLRHGEPAFAALGLENGALDEASVVDALLTHPELLQRPIVEDATRALIARPPERIDAFLASGAVP